MWAAAPTFSGVLLLSCERCLDNHLVHRVFVSVWRLGLLRTVPSEWVVFLAHRRLLTGALGQEVMADFLEHGHRHPVRVFNMYQEWSLHHVAVLCRVLTCPPELVQHVALAVFSQACTMHTIVNMGPGALDLFLELCGVHWAALGLTCLGKALLSANPADFPAAVAGVQKTVLLQGFCSMSTLPTLFRLIMREEWTFEAQHAPEPNDLVEFWEGWMRCVSRRSDFEVVLGVAADLVRSAAACIAPRGLFSVHVLWCLCREVRMGRNLRTMSNGAQGDLHTIACFLQPVYPVIMDRIWSITLRREWIAALVS
jgi:hypothetical protein